MGFDSHYAIEVGQFHALVPKSAVKPGVRAGDYTLDESVDPVLIQVTKSRATVKTVFVSDAVYKRMQGKALAAK